MYRVKYFCFWAWDKQWHDNHRGKKKKKKQKVNIAKRTSSARPGFAMLVDAPQCRRTRHGFVWVSHPLRGNTRNIMTVIISREFCCEICLVCDNIHTQATAATWFPSHSARHPLPDDACKRFRNICTISRNVIGNVYCTRCYVTK